VILQVRRFLNERDGGARRIDAIVSRLEGIAGDARVTKETRAQARECLTRARVIAGEERKS
jgi:hypothetical protein